jgi:hypothetical protein
VPVAVLALIGLYDLRRNRLVQLLLIVGLLAAPIPAVIKGAPYAIQRASGLLIFVCLFAGAGLAALAASRRGMARASAVILVILGAYEFTSFYRDYHTRYRNGSARAYDPTAFRGAAELVFAADAERAASEVYLPSNFYDVGAKWRFYTLKHERTALWHRTKYFADPSALDAAPADAIAVIPQAGDQVALPERWTTIGVSRDPAGEPTATVIRRR